MNNIYHLLICKTEITWFTTGHESIVSYTSCLQPNYSYSAVGKIIKLMTEW